MDITNLERSSHYEPAKLVKEISITSGASDIFHGAQVTINQQIKKISTSLQVTKLITYPKYIFRKKSETCEKWKKH
jgi:hypothetical protein